MDGLEGLIRWFHEQTRSDGPFQPQNGCTIRAPRWCWFCMLHLRPARTLWFAFAPQAGERAMTAAKVISAAAATGLAARRAIRAGAHLGSTSGLAPGYVQGNLAILPQALAGDFIRFCQLNPKPCPLVGMSAPGDPRIPALGEDLDIRTDLPRYRVGQNGKIVDEPTDLTSVWRDDLVSFVIGCSFSFEEALMADGLEIRNITCGCHVPMYRTSIETAPAGPFHGATGVSMRPFQTARGEPATPIPAPFPPRAAAR